MGGPSTGQILPGLDLGGPPRADVAGDGSGSYVNGRELHPLEVQRLIRRYGSVTPGRYRMNARLIGGLEGGPASFDPNAATAAAGGGCGIARGSGRYRVVQPFQ